MSAPQQQDLAPAPSGNGGTAVARRDPAKSKVLDLKGYFKKIEGSVAAALPKHMKPERVFGIVVAAASRNPQLLECTFPSIAQAVMQSAELGLTPGAMLGEAYLVPRKNRKANPPVTECLLIPGYKGLLKLARQSGLTQEINAQLVFKGEFFEVEMGLEPKLKHVPDLSKRAPVTDPKDAKARLLYVYAVAKLKDGGHAYEVMTLDEIEAIRLREDKKDERWSPWKSDYGQMARKTVLRRLCNYLPKSPDLERAVALESAHAAGEKVTSEELGFTAIDAEFEVVDEATGEVTTSSAAAAPQSATDALKAQMKAQG